METRLAEINLKLCEGEGGVRALKTQPPVHVAVEIVATHRVRTTVITRRQRGVTRTRLLAVRPPRPNNSAHVASEPGSTAGDQTWISRAFSSARLPDLIKRRPSQRHCKEYVVGSFSFLSFS